MSIVTEVYSLKSQTPTGLQMTGGMATGGRWATSPSTGRETTLEGLPPQPPDYDDGQHQGAGGQQLQGREGYWVAGGLQQVVPQAVVGHLAEDEDVMRGGVDRAGSHGVGLAGNENRDHGWQASDYSKLEHLKSGSPELPGQPDEHSQRDKREFPPWHIKNRSDARIVKCPEDVHGLGRLPFGQLWKSTSITFKCDANKWQIPKDLRNGMQGIQEYIKRDQQEKVDQLNHAPPSGRINVNNISFQIADYVAAIENPESDCKSRSNSKQTPEQVHGLWPVTFPGSALPHPGNQRLQRKGEQVGYQQEPDQGQDAKTGKPLVGGHGLGLTPRSRFVSGRLVRSNGIVDESLLPLLGSLCTKTRYDNSNIDWNDNPQAEKRQFQAVILKIDDTKSADHSSNDRWNDENHRVMYFISHLTNGDEQRHGRQRHISWWRLSHLMRSSTARTRSLMAQAGRAGRFAHSSKK